MTENVDNQKNSVKIISKIIQYHLDDLHFDYDDGSFEWFDSSELCIIEPVKLRTKKFFIFHNKPILENIIWRKIGLIIELKSYDDKMDLLRTIFGIHVFSDGIKISEYKF